MNTMRDGISVSDGRYNNGVFASTSINPDLVGEMRVIVAPADAEMGRGVGQVQIMTKSGTNTYRGTAVWNIQNSALDANTWNGNRIGTTPTWYNREQLTGSYGGPIIRNKTFFFALLNGQRMYSRQNVVYSGADGRCTARLFPILSRSRQRQRGPGSREAPAIRRSLLWWTCWAIR